MSFQPKRKRDEQPDNEMALIIRDFYGQLFLHMMIPALILGFMFGLPVLLLHNLPDRLNASCSIYEGDIGIRIVSETTRMNITTYYWTDDHSENWHLIGTEERSYQSARVDCDEVSFDSGLVALTINGEIVRIGRDGEILSDNHAGK